jgi:hypothetical protein
MDHDGKGILGDPKATAEEIRQAWEYAALAAMQEHRKAAEPVVTWDWEANRVVLVSPDEFAEPEVVSLSDNNSQTTAESPFDR